jgi:hypothetical protein
MGFVLFWVVGVCGLLVAWLGPLRTWLASAQLPRIGFVLFLDKKNQKSSQKRGFFARKAFALQAS